MTELPGNRPSPGRILIIVENLPVPFDRRVWMEATTLTDAGYAVSVICPKGKGFVADHEEINGIHIYRHELPPEKSSVLGYLREYSSALWNEWKLARLIRKKHDFDVIHLCNPPDLLFIVALWFKLFHRKKMLYDQHDLTPELYESKFNRRDLFYHLMRCAERLTYFFADTVISTNESYRETAISRGGKKPEDVFIVRSGPDLNKFRPVPAVRTYHNDKTFLIGYLGVMGEFDGVDHLVHAAHILIHTMGRKDVHFCFIGSGPMLESLKTLAREKEIESYTTFTGRISDEEMINRLSSCDVCVNPDPLNPLNDKSTMNKILEYMALAKPIVQYDLKEGRRSAKDASLYARPNDQAHLAKCIAALLDNPEQCKQMGAIGQKRMVEELEWKHQRPKLLRAYDHLFRLT